MPIITIKCGSGIDSVTIRYNDENGWTNYVTVTSTEILNVSANTTQYVTSISLKNGFSHPVTCTGESSWQMTNYDGSFIDETLVVGSYDKTFTFSVGSTGGGTGGTPSGNGLVWINGNWYQPYIYTGTWTVAKPYIYSDGTWNETKKV